MNTQDIEDQVIENLKKNAFTILHVLDQDTQKALTGDADAISAINVNFRTLAAMNEVLLYYGDVGVFAADGAL